MTTITTRRLVGLCLGVVLTGSFLSTAFPQTVGAQGPRPQSQRAASRPIPPEEDMDAPAPEEETREVDTADEYEFKLSCLELIDALQGDQIIDEKCFKDSKQNEQTRTLTSSMTRYMRASVSLAAEMATNVRRLGSVQTAAQEIMDELRRYGKGKERDNAELTIYSIVDASDASIDRYDMQREASEEIDSQEVEPRYALIEAAQERSRAESRDAERAAASLSESVGQVVKRLSVATDSTGQRVMRRELEMMSMNGGRRESSGVRLSPCPPGPAGTEGNPTWCRQAVTELDPVESLTAPGAAASAGPAASRGAAPVSANAFAMGATLRQSAPGGANRANQLLAMVGRSGAPAASGSTPTQSGIATQCPSTDADASVVDAEVLYTRASVQLDGQQMNSASILQDVSLTRTEVGLLRATDRETRDAIRRNNQLKGLGLASPLGLAGMGIPGVRP